MNKEEGPGRADPSQDNRAGAGHEECKQAEPQQVAAGQAEVRQGNTEQVEANTGELQKTVGDDMLQERRQHAAEALLEDEGLQMHLAGDSFQNLLNWALDQADRYAESTATIRDDEQANTAIDTYLDRLRGILRTVDSLVGSRNRVSQSEFKRRLARLPQMVNGLNGTSRGIASIGSQLQAIARRKDQPEDELVRRIVAALPGGAAFVPEPEEPSPVPAPAPRAVPRPPALFEYTPGSDNVVEEGQHE